MSDIGNTGDDSSFESLKVDNHFVAYFGDEKQKFSGSEISVKTLEVRFPKASCMALYSKDNSIAYPVDRNGWINIENGGEYMLLPKHKLKKGKHLHRKGNYSAPLREAMKKTIESQSPERNLNSTAVPKGLEITLKRFDMSKIVENRVILIIGKRGKTSLVLDYLLFHNRNSFSRGKVISPTEEYNHKYGTHIPTTCIHDEYDSDLIDKFLKDQKKCNLQKKV